jgi:hypothetical protein
MKDSIFWNITPCSPVKVSQRSGGRCRLHLQDRRTNQARALLVICLHAGFLLGLIFDPEDEGDMFLQSRLTFTGLYGVVSQKINSSEVM